MKLSYALVSVIAASTFVFTACSEEEVIGTVSTVEQRNLVQSVMSSGKVYPEIEVKIIPEVPGEVQKIYVKEGDTVRKGDKLAFINPDLLREQANSAEAQVLSVKANLENARAQVTQAEVQLKQADIEFKRNTDLFDKKVISEIDFVNARTRYEVAKASKLSAEQALKAQEYSVQAQEASLKQVRTNLSRTTIFAPIDGVVTSIAIEEGKVVAGVSQFNASELMTISKLDNIEVRITVGENDVLEINEGDEAKITIDSYLGRNFSGRVRSISTASKGGASALGGDQPANYEVKVRIDKDSYSDLEVKLKKFPFLPGMSASVEIETEKTKQAITVPIEAVTVREDLLTNEEIDASISKEFVFVIENGKAVKREVKTGIQDQRYIQILEGLKVGEVILSGPYTFVHKEVLDGQAVKTQTKEQADNKAKEDKKAGKTKDDK